MKWCIIGLNCLGETLAWEGSCWSIDLSKAVRFDTKETAVQELVRNNMRGDKKIQLWPSEDVDRWQIQDILLEKKPEPTYGERLSK